MPHAANRRSDEIDFLLPPEKKIEIDAQLALDLEESGVKHDRPFPVRIVHDVRATRAL